jgi:hypothetical protein
MFEVPKSRASVKQNRFEFKLEGSDRVYSVPLLKFLPAKSVQAFEDGKELRGILLAADDPATRAALEDLDGDQLGALAEAWSAESGVTPGESSTSGG